MSKEDWLEDLKKFIQRPEIEALIKENQPSEYLEGSQVDKILKLTINTIVNLPSGHVYPKFMEPVANILQAIGLEEDCLNSENRREFNKLTRFYSQLFKGDEERMSHTEIINQRGFSNR